MSNGEQRAESATKEPIQRWAPKSLLVIGILTVFALVVAVVLITSPTDDRYKGWPQPSSSPTDQLVDLGYGSDPAFRPQLQVTFTCDRDEGMIIEPEMLVDVDGAHYYNYVAFWRSALSHSGGTCSAAWQWLSNAVGNHIVMHATSGADSWSYTAASYIFFAPMGDGDTMVSEGEYGVLLVEVDDLPQGPQLTIGPNGIYMPARPVA